MQLSTSFGAMLVVFSMVHGAPLSADISGSSTIKNVAQRTADSAITAPGAIGNTMLERGAIKELIKTGGLEDIDKRGWGSIFKALGKIGATQVAEKGAEEGAEAVSSQVAVPDIARRGSSSGKSNGGSSWASGLTTGTASGLLSDGITYGLTQGIDSDDDGEDDSAERRIRRDSYRGSGDFQHDGKSPGGDSSYSSSTSSLSDRNTDTDSSSKTDIGNPGTFDHTKPKAVDSAREIASNPGLDDAQRMTHGAGEPVERAMPVRAAKRYVPGGQEATSRRKLARTFSA